MRIKIQEWLKNEGDNVFEFPGKDIKSQIVKWEESNTGLGFVFVGVLVAKIEDGETPHHSDMLSVPVIKIQGEWYTAKDENLRDILSGVIRSVTPAG
jgi:hypothetical protein